MGVEMICTGGDRVGGTGSVRQEEPYHHSVKPVSILIVYTGFYRLRNPFLSFTSQKEKETFFENSFFRIHDDERVELGLTQCV